MLLRASKTATPTGINCRQTKGASNDAPYLLSRGLKQSELAEQVGVEDKTISRIEVGGNYPSMDLLVRISNVLDYDLCEFVNFKSKIEYTFDEMTKDEIKVIKKFVKLLDEKIR